MSTRRSVALGLGIALACIALLVILFWPDIFGDSVRRKGARGHGRDVLPPRAVVPTVDQAPHIAPGEGWQPPVFRAPERHDAREVAIAPPFLEDPGLETAPLDSDPNLGVPGPDATPLEHVLFSFAENGPEIAKACADEHPDVDRSRARLIKLVVLPADGETPATIVVSEPEVADDEPEDERALMECLAREVEAIDIRHLPVDAKIELELPVQLLP